MEKISFIDVILSNQRSSVSVRYIEAVSSFYKRNSMTIVPIQKSEFDGLLKDDKSLKYHSDIWLITNEQRLAQLSSDSVRQLQQALTDRSIPSPFEGFSDEQIIASIKSRNIQSPAELKGFFEQMDESFKALTAELDLFKPDPDKSDQEKTNQNTSTSGSSAAQQNSSSDK